MPGQRDAHAMHASRVAPVLSKVLEKVLNDAKFADQPQYCENLIIERPDEEEETIPLETAIDVTGSPTGSAQRAASIAEEPVDIHARFVIPFERLAQNFEWMADVVDEAPTSLENDFPGWRNGLLQSQTEEESGTKAAVHKPLTSSGKGEQAGSTKDGEQGKVAKLIIDPASRNLKEHSALWMSVTVPILEGGSFLFVSLRDVAIKKEDMAKFFRIFAPPENETMQAERIRARGGGGSGVRSEKGEEGENNEKKTAEFKKGDKIEANYNGKGEYYPGKIFLVLHGTYSIEYDEVSDTGSDSIKESVIASLQKKYNGEDNVLRKVLSEQFGTIPNSDPPIQCDAEHALGIDFETVECTARSDDDILEALKKEEKGLTAEQYAHLTTPNATPDKRYVHKFQHSYVHKVTRVVEHSEAQLKGICEGDLIVELNGKAISHLSKEQLLNCWRESQGETSKTVGFRKKNKGTEFYSVVRTKTVEWPERGWHTFPLFDNPGDRLRKLDEASRGKLRGGQGKRRKPFKLSSGQEEPDDDDEDDTFILKQHHLFGWQEEGGKLAIIAEGDSAALTAPAKKGYYRGSAINPG
jgi:hypothetical protein